MIVNYTYAYDGLNRLVQVANGTPAQQEDYSYDPLGNRTAKTVNATTPVKSVSLFDAANQLLETRSGSATGTLLQAYVYDASGNLIKKAEGGTVTRTSTDCTGNTVTGLGYNSLNRLTQVSKTGLRIRGQTTFSRQGNVVCPLIPLAPSPCAGTRGLTGHRTPIIQTSFA